jgi:hypothetical protein
MYLYIVSKIFFLIIISLGLNACASTSSKPYRKRDTGSTYERRAAFEEQRQQSHRSSASHQGPVVVFPILWYRW